jgi:predicted membrane channel-forming protein YqfA (hemolysin III family)
MTEDKFWHIVVLVASVSMVVMLVRIIIAAIEG